MLKKGLPKTLKFFLKNFQEACKRFNKYSP